MQGEIGHERVPVYFILGKGKARTPSRIKINTPTKGEKILGW